MHPALSIILFTTASGFGYGLAIMLGINLLDPATIPAKLAHLVALSLIAAALLASTLHLGNPQRAWRAFSQWRSSWLSREGVMAVLTFAPLCLAAYATIFESRYAPAAGLLGVAGAVLTVYCTSMIYASLKSVQAWHSWLTSACYLLFAGSGGAVLGSFFAAAGGQGAAPLYVLALVFLAGAWGAKLAWRNRMLTIRPLSSPESATGLGPIGRVRLFERPHVNENYLTHEMGYRVARKHARKLASVALALGGVLPFALLLVLLAVGAFEGGFAVVTTLLAVVAHFIGVLIERWLFFAEARHAVMNYYGG
jgi:DMSO reductase anchor subunit